MIAGLGLRECLWKQQKKNAGKDTQDNENSLYRRVH